MATKTIIRRITTLFSLIYRVWIPLSHGVQIYLHERILVEICSFGFPINQNIYMGEYLLIYTHIFPIPQIQCLGNRKLIIKYQKNGPSYIKMKNDPNIFSHFVEHGYNCPIDTLKYIYMGEY